MATKVKYNITTVVGSYLKDGEKKNKYKTVGQVMEKEDSSRYIYIDPYFNFGAVNRSYNKNGEMVISDSVLCSLMEPKAKEGNAQQGKQEEFDE